MARMDSEQRARILEAAVGVFAGHGFKGATTRLLGAAAQVNSALIYYYFENKETLFAETIDMVIHGFLSRLEVGRRAFKDARDRLDYLAKGLFDYYIAYPERRRLMIIALSMHPEMFGRALGSVLGKRRLLPLDILAEGMERGEIRKMSPISAWLNVVGACMFSFLLREVAPHLGAAPIALPSLDGEERRRTIVDLLTNGMRERGENSPGRGGACGSARSNPTGETQ